MNRYNRHVYIKSTLSPKKEVVLPYESAFLFILSGALLHAHEKLQLNFYLKGATTNVNMLIIYIILYFPHSKQR